MKKLLFAILSSLLVFILAGCGENEKEQKSEKRF